jgi:hypothetical protein
MAGAAGAQVVFRDLLHNYIGLYVAIHQRRESRFETHLLIATSHPVDKTRRIQGGSLSESGPFPLRDSATRFAPFHQRRRLRVHGRALSRLRTPNRRPGKQNRRAVPALRDGWTRRVRKRDPGPARPRPELRKEAYANLDAWQKTMVARHPERPHLRDYVAGLIDEFVELRGDRKFADDQAIVGGLGRFRGQPVVVMGHEKGHDTTTRLKHNFGMARPEGYRKAVRLMDMAERFNLPVITFVDTAGAYPGLGAEERGQAEAIARSTERCLTLEPRWSPPSSAKAAAAGPSPWPAPTGADPGALDLFGDLAGRRGLDPVARRRPGQGRGHQHEDHRPGPDQAEDRRPHHRGAGRRGAFRHRPPPSRPSATRSRTS